MTDRKMSEAELETLFEAARATRAEPSAALLARVMDDAMAEIAGAPAPGPAPEPVRRRGPGLGGPGLGGLVAALGGWPALGGLATAGVVGVWIGYTAPGGLEAITATMLGGGYGAADLVPSLDAYLTEG